ncbi:unnamed protein product [Caenorhabditis brenneri]
MEDYLENKSLIRDPSCNHMLCERESVQSSNEATCSERSSDQLVLSIGELTLDSSSDQKNEQTAKFGQANEMFSKDDALESAEVFIHFELVEENFIMDDSKFILSIKSHQLIQISEGTSRNPKISQERNREHFLRTNGNVTSASYPSLLSVSTPRIPLTMENRDQLRAMIVLLKESNSVLLKIRQRFPLSASTRCDVIQCQIQMQLQELFGEFRSNDENRFREMIPQNRRVFLTIWDLLAQLIVDSCYHQ